MFNKILSRPTDDIRAADFTANEAVWGRVVRLAKKEWEEKLNEDYLKDMLQRFDCESLKFRAAKQ